MDRWIALGIIVVVTVAFAFVTCLLITEDKARQHTDEQHQHAFRGQGEAVTVAELLADAKERGEPIRLNWPTEDVDEAGLMRPYVQDQFPTAELPRIEKIMRQNPRSNH